jgi:hypothetical protein
MATMIGRRVWVKGPLPWIATVTAEVPHGFRLIDDGGNDYIVAGPTLMLSDDEAIEYCEQLEHDLSVMRREICGAELSIANSAICLKAANDRLHPEPPAAGGDRVRADVRRSL